MYIRFISKKVNEESNSPEGIFYSIWSLIDKEKMAAHEIATVDACFDWFGMHFKAPTCLSESENRRAICWFKETAVEPMKRIWPIVNVLEQHDIHILKITCNDPGIIVYESGWQVAAKPYKKGKDYSRGLGLSKYQSKINRK